MLLPCKLGRTRTARTSEAMWLVVYDARRRGMLERPTPRLSTSRTLVAGWPQPSSASSSSSCGAQQPSVHAKPARARQMLNII